MTCIDDDDDDGDDGDVGDDDWQLCEPPCPPASEHHAQAPEEAAVQGTSGEPVACQ
jgi:hypothetical protein